MAAGGFPHPTIHDEFSYLLGADTFASGRLTNPPHPLWPFFETIHVLSQPTYASKYQPGQALFLALGQAVFGHPYYGVLLQNVLLFAALCWMLQQWLAPGWALIGSLLAIVAIGFAHYWVISYWGGSAAALGAALLLGAYRKVTYWEQYRYGWLVGAAIALLLITRPFEGGLLVIFLATSVVVRTARQPGAARSQFLKRCLTPAVGVLALTLSAQGVYNLAVTGNVLELPYTLVLKKYQIIPFLWPQAVGPLPTYGNESLRVQYTEWEPQMYRALYQMSVSHRALYLLQRIAETLNSTLPLMPLLPLVFLFWASRSVRFLALAMCFGTVGLCLETWFLPHYLAPWLPLALLLSLLVVRHLRSIRWRGRSAGVELGIILLTISFGLALLTGVARLRDFAKGPSTLNVGLERSRLIDQIAHVKSKHVIIVRYAPGHNVTQEWVYNSANIDSAPVVWAHDRGAVENRALLKYFTDRTIWLFEPDRVPATLRPYAEEP